MGENASLESGKQQKRILGKIKAQRGLRTALGCREEFVRLMGGEAHELDLEEPVGMISTW